MTLDASETGHWTNIEALVSHERKLLDGNRGIEHQFFAVRVDK